MRVAMRRHVWIGCAAWTILTVAGSASAGQSASASGQSSRAQPAVRRVSSEFTTPRTPWGDPDLAGSYNTDAEFRTPLERPPQFDGRRLEDITPQELLAFKKELKERDIKISHPPQGVPGAFLPGGNSYLADLLFADPLVSGHQAWFIVDPPDGKIPPMTAEGKQRNDALAAARKNSGRGAWDSHEDAGLFVRCVMRGNPPEIMLPSVYGNQYDITQAPGFVAIRYDWLHETRVIPVDGRPHVAPSLRQQLGDARGRWDGDTLIVETSNFTDKMPFRGSSRDMKLTETFTRISADKMRWTATMDDPKTWVRPWTISQILTNNPAQPVWESECHEGNYGLAFSLSGARADEQREAEEKKKQEGR